MSAVIRLKRKASSEPIEALVVALKRSKSDEIKSNEVFFKFAATLKSEKESIKDHIQAVLNKGREENFSKWRDPKCMALNQRNVNNICEKLKKECKAASQKKRLDLLNNRRLIFAETVPIDDSSNDALVHNAEVRKLFQLYDITEENEEPKKQVNDVASNITCNGEILISEKSSDYVYDVYIADGQMDKSFVENTISLRPCTMTNDDIYSGDSDDDSESHEDEDDSNDENNWRNEYPEDEDSNSDREGSEEYDVNDYCDELEYSFNRTKLVERTSSDEESFHYSKTLEEVLIQDDYGGSD